MRTLFIKPVVRVCFLWMILLFSCTNEEIPVPLTVYGDTMLTFYLNKASAVDTKAHGGGNSWNIDYVDQEDSVSTVRILIFDSGTGGIVHNRLFNVDTDFSGDKKDNVSFLVNNGGGRSCNLFFVANENVETGGTFTPSNGSPRTETTARYSLTTDLDNIRTQAALNSLNIQYSPMFHATRHQYDEDRFLMTARYDRIQLPEGGTVSSPKPIPLVTGSGKVEFRRALAKVTLYISSLILHNGDGTADWFSPGRDFVGVDSICTMNMPENYSVFPVNRYNSFTLANHVIFGNDINRHCDDAFFPHSGPDPAFYKPTGQGTPGELPWEGGSDTGIGEIPADAFRVTFYIPEYLRENNDLNPRIDVNYTVLVNNNREKKTVSYEVFSKEGKGMDDFYSYDIGNLTLYEKSIYRNNWYLIFFKPGVPN